METRALAKRDYAPCCGSASSFRCSLRWPNLELASRCWTASRCFPCSWSLGQTELVSTFQTRCSSIGLARSGWSKDNSWRTLCCQGHLEVSWNACCTSPASLCGFSWSLFVLSGSRSFGSSLLVEKLTCSPAWSALIGSRFRSGNGMLGVFRRPHSQAMYSTNEHRHSLNLLELDTFWCMGWSWPGQRSDLCLQNFERYQLHFLWKLELTCQCKSFYTVEDMAL